MKSSKRKFSGLMFSLLAMLAVFTPNVAQANVSAGIVSRCEVIKATIESTDVDKVYFTEYIVTCIKTVVTESFLQFMLGFYNAIEPAIAPTLTLAVIFFGVMSMTGLLQKPARDVFILLVKIAFIGAFVQPDMVAWMYDNSLIMLEGLTDLVFQFGKGIYTGPCIDNATLWDRIDCMLDTLIGLKAAADTPAGEPSGISRGMINFFMANMASSGIGFFIGLIGLYVIWTILFALLKSIHTYLAAILGLAFIILIAPMMIPMLLFRATREYFNKWYRIIIAFILQPMLLFGFICMMFAVFDAMLITGPHSLMQTATGGLCVGKNINQCYEENGLFAANAISQFNDVSDPGLYAGQLASERARGMVASPMRDLTGASAGNDDELKNFFEISRSFESIDYARLSQLIGASDSAEIQRKLSLATILLALTAFIFVSVLNYIPTLANDLSGGVYEVPNLFNMVGKNIPGQAYAEVAAEKFSSQVRKGGNDVIDRFKDQFNTLVGGR